MNPIAKLNEFQQQRMMAREAETKAEKAARLQQEMMQAGVGNMQPAPYSPVLPASAYQPIYVRSSSEHLWSLLTDPWVWIVFVFLGSIVYFGTHSVQKLRRD